MFEQLSMERKRKPCLTDTFASVGPGRNQEQVDSPLHPHQSAILFTSLKLGQRLMTSSEGAFLPCRRVRNKTGPHSKNMQSDAMWCSAAVKRRSYGVFGAEFSVEHTQHGRLRMCCSGEVSRMDNLWNHTSLYETLQTLPRLVSDYLLALETAAMYNLYLTE